VEVRSSEGLGRSAVCKPKLARLPCPELGDCSEPNERVRLSAVTSSATRIDLVVWKMGIGLVSSSQTLTMRPARARWLIVAQLFAFECGTVLDPSERRQRGSELRNGTLAKNSL
jgi:hypothetical protein